MHAPGAPLVLWTVTCAGGDGAHAWERPCLLLLQKQAGLNCLHMYEIANTHVPDQVYTDKSMTMLPHFNI